MKKLLAFLFVILFPVSVQAALPATAVWEIRNATGSQNNGGCFSSARGGADYSQATNPTVNNTDGGSVTTSTTFTTASTFPADLPGNCIHITTTGTGAQCIVGWYEVVTRTDANNVVLDRAPSAGTGCVAATWAAGGALALGGTLDDDIFETCVAGNIYYMNGNVTLGEAVAINAAGTSTLKCKFIGYVSSRTDAPVPSAAPVMASAANVFAFGADWTFEHVAWTGTATLGVVQYTGARGSCFYCKSTNQSIANANRGAFVFSGTDGVLAYSEAVSLRGRGVMTQTVSRYTIIGNYIHDSDTGILTAGNAMGVIRGNIFASNVTAAISIAATVIAQIADISYNTFYGAEDKANTGSAILIAAGASGLLINNNIINGFANGINQTDAAPAMAGRGDYNQISNTTTPYTAWVDGANSSTTAPSFTSIGQTTGTGATSATTVLTDSGKDFTAAGVVAGRDYVYVSSATTATVAQYEIASVGTTTLTLVESIGTGSNIVYQITRGRNFAVGTGIKALGWPGAITAYTTGYTEPGAVQRQEAASGGVKNTSPIIK